VVGALVLAFPGPSDAQNARLTFEQVFGSSASSLTIPFANVDAQCIATPAAGVTCYADPAALTDTARSRLRAFLHRLGRETKQGEVGIIIGDKYYGITEYDSE